MTLIPKVFWPTDDTDVRQAPHNKPINFVGNSTLHTTLNNKAKKNIRKNDCTGLHFAGFIATMICLLAISKPSLAADDDYLRSLENESTNSRTSTTNTSGSSSNYLDALSAEAEASAKVATGDQHDEAYYKKMKKMEAVLEEKKPSTFKFYKKLTPKKQALVYDHYAADESDSGDRLSHLQKKIMDIYFKR
jgi:hypothetical protein